MVKLNDILTWCDEQLEPGRFHDYCPNGLQVEGRGEVKLIVTGVTACQALLDAAIELGADAILVHHGYFWKGEPVQITGLRKRRLATLLKHDVSLIAYHLPLDAHTEIGNNAQLANRLGFLTEGLLNPDAIGNVGRLPNPMPIKELIQRITSVLGREPLWIDGGPPKVARVAWCTGAAQGYIDQAAQQGVDLYLSGEISEQTTHIAREAGLHYLSAGHHATESFGVQALGEWMAQVWGVDHIFLDIPNPV